MFRHTAEISLQNVEVLVKENPPIEAVKLLGRQNCATGKGVSSTVKPSWYRFSYVSGLPAPTLRRCSVTYATSSGTGPDGSEGPARGDPSGMRGGEGHPPPVYKKPSLEHVCGWLAELVQQLERVPKERWKETEC